MGLSPSVPIKMWLVDDDAKVRELLQELLRHQPGLCCERAFSSAESVLIALGTDAAPHVILMDVRMQEMSGLEAVGLIKAVAPHTHVVMLTTFDDAVARRRALASGAADYLLKRDGSEGIVDSPRRLAPAISPQVTPIQDDAITRSLA